MLYEQLIKDNNGVIYSNIIGLVKNPKDDSAIKNILNLIEKPSYI